VALWCGTGFYHSYSALNALGSDLLTNEPAPPSDTALTAASANTNAAPSTNTVAGAPGDATETNVVSPGTNVLAGATNQIAARTNKSARAKKPPKVRPTIVTLDPESASRGSVAYLAGLVVGLVGLGLLIAHDFTHLVGARAVDLLFDDLGEGIQDSEYDKAEVVWKDGQPLEAIQMMRDYLKLNPHKQFVALRIAEIYEKDLKNYLAASLEYEEVLKCHLPSERWAWAAIHLCNLYIRTNRQEKAVALLQRIVAEHPKSAAAKKARQKLGLTELEEEAPPAEEAPDTEHVADLDKGPQTVEEFLELEARATSAREKEESPPPPPPPPKSNLPPGFRPKDQ